MIIYELAEAKTAGTVQELKQTNVHEFFNLLTLKRKWDKEVQKAYKQ